MKNLDDIFSKEDCENLVEWASVRRQPIEAQLVTYDLDKMDKATGGRAMSKRDELVKAYDDAYRAYDEANRALIEATRAWYEANRALQEYDKKQEETK